MLDRGEQRPGEEIVLAEQVFVAQLGAARLGQPDAEQLPRIVPLVERLGRRQALVALQPDERRVKNGRQCLRGLGLADARLALQEDRLTHPYGEEERGRERRTRQVPGGVEAHGERVDIRDDSGKVSRGLGRRLFGHPCDAPVRYRCGSAVNAALQPEPQK